VLAALVESGRSLVDLLAGMRKLPQVLINVRVAGGAKALVERPAVVAEVAAVERELGARGRVLLRASGTEPLVRVMVEADDAALTQRMAERIAEVVRGLA
ncbi:MAG: phosphoglucosamine mutase, partial [Nevskiaceae bacterium]